MMPRYRCEVQLRMVVVVEADGPDDACSVARQEVSDESDWLWDDVQVVSVEPAPEAER